MFLWHDKCPYIINTNYTLMAFVYPENKIAPKKGRLLIAQPLLPDSIFSRTAILLCEHNSQESFGLIINKLTDFRFETDTEETLSSPNTLVKLYDGGPVSPDSMFIIHNQAHLAEPNSEIMPGLYFGGKYDDFFASIQNGDVDETQFKAFLGYSGWKPGQLEEEIAEGTWFVKDTSSQEVLISCKKQDWKKLISSMGEDFQPLSLFPERDYYN